MPVSDQLLVLALALASPANPQLPLSLNADSIGQPTGGAHAPARAVGEKRDSTTAADKCVTKNNNPPAPGAPDPTGVTYTPHSYDGGRHLKKATLACDKGSGAPALRAPIYIKK